MAEALQRECDLPQLHPRVVRRNPESVGESRARRPELVDHVRDADLRAVAAAVGFLEPGGQSDRFGLGERPAEHRAGDRFEQSFAQLSPADPGERVQPRPAAGGEPQDGSAERVDEGFVFAFEVDDLAAAAEHARAQQPGLGQARLAEVRPADHQRVGVVQQPPGVEDPRVVDEAPAVHIPADVNPLSAKPGLGNCRIDRLEVRGGDLMPGPLPRQPAPTEPSGRAL